MQQNIQDKLNFSATPAGDAVQLRANAIFRFAQVYEVSSKETRRRSQTAAKSTRIRIANMRKALEEADLTIERGKTSTEIFALAVSTHGGNCRGDPGEFVWSNRTARNTIRHVLTNYKAQWNKINRGLTGKPAYSILRNRADALVEEAYPQYAEGMPEVSCPLPPIKK